MKHKPIKRHQALQPLSREHHQGLLLVYKINQGLKKQVEPNRIKRYINWFFDRYLIPHFEAEERHLFPLLGNDDSEIKEALDQHHELNEMRKKPEASEVDINAFKTLLNTHIRFEERQLFNRIQAVATASELQQLEGQLSEIPFQENTEDEFWLHTNL